MTFMNWVGILGVVAVAACWTLAVVLFRVGSQGSMARKLGLLLVIEGVALVTAGFPEYVLGIGENDPFWEDHLAYAISNFVVHHLADAGMIIFYLPFLASALQTRLTRPFANRKVQIAIAIVAIAMAAGTVVTMSLWESMLGSMILYVSLMSLFLFAFVASIHAWRIAKPGIARSRAGLFAIAFGIRDVCWCFVYGSSWWLIASGSFSDQSSVFWTGKIIYALGTLLAVPLIAYGVLRGLLFDIDLKIRWTIKQSTVAGFIVAFVFLVSEGASVFFSSELGTVAGLFAAAVIIFFLTPLQQFAERVAASAMPNTENTPEYRAFRKMQVYETAIIEALEEGDISAKERMLLKRLHESLDISPADADAIEAEVRSRLSNGDEPLAQPA